MNSEADNDQTLWINQYLAEESNCDILVLRDEADSFVIDIAPKTTEAKGITKSEVLLLLPTSRRWSQALGWRSIFGVPLFTNGRKWLAIGTMTISAHPTRGGFPILGVHIFPFEKPPLDRLRAIADAIHVLPEASKRERVGGAYGVILTGDHSPEEHTSVEAEILWHSTYWYGSQERFMFSTLVLSEDQLKSSNFPGPDYHPGSKSPRLTWRRYLLSTTNVLCTDPSSREMRWASLRRLVI